MSGSVAQVFEHVDTASGTTSVVAATFTGNGVIACATNDASAASTISCADPTNGTYTPLDDILDTTDQQRFAHFGKANSTASGAVSVTFTWTAANVFKAGAVVDCTGVAGALDQHTGAYQHLPTTTANTQLSGTTATLNAAAASGALVVGLGFASGGNAPPAQGTTGGTWNPPVSGQPTFWSFGGGLTLRIEWQRVTSTAGVQAVFTSAANIDAITTVAVIDETAPASTPTVLTPPLPPTRGSDPLSSGARSYVAYPPTSPAAAAAPAMSWQAIAPRLVIAPRLPLSTFVAKPVTTPAAPALPPMGWLVPQVRPPIPAPAQVLGQKKGGAAYQAALPGVLNFSWMTQPIFPIAPQLFVRASSPVVPPTVPAGNTTLLLSGGISDERSGAEALIGALAQVGGASGESAGVESLIAALALAGGVSSEIAGAATLASALAMVGGASLEASGALAIAAALQQAGGLSSESPGAASLAALLALVGGASEERPGSFALIQSLITLLMVGGASTEAGGAETIAATLAPAGGSSSELAGNALLSAALAIAGGKSDEAAGAASVIIGLITLLMSGGASGEAAGAPTSSGTLAQSGGKSGEAAGAEALTGLLLQAGGLSEERAGALTGHGILALAGAASSEVPGAEALAAVLAQAGGLSEERAGAIAVQVVGILLLISSGHSDGAAGAETMTALLKPPGGQSSEAAGNVIAAQILTMAGGISEETAGAIIQKIGHRLSARLGAGPLRGTPKFRGPTS